jgi:hypothetical protein
MAKILHLGIFAQLTRLHGILQGCQTINGHDHDRKKLKSFKRIRERGNLIVLIVLVAIRTIGFDRGMTVLIV